MVTTIDWPNSIINIPRADLTLIQSVPTEIRQLNLDTFRLDLKDLEDGSQGMVWLRTHKHNAPVTVGGVVLSRVVQIINGYTITFEDGQYAVNLVGANSNVADVTNVNQVSIRSANSAGLQDLTTLLIAAFNGQVALHPTLGQAGTDTPIGTRGTPVNNLDDAKAIGIKNGIAEILVLGPLTLTDIDFTDTPFTFVGDNPVAVELEITSSVVVPQCQFKNMTISGVLDGGSTLRDCNLLEVAFVEGFVIDCALNRTVTLVPGQTASFFNCFSNIPGSGAKPTIDLGISGSLAIRNYNGGLRIQNFAGPGNVSIDMNAGVLLIDSTVTGGTITVRGTASVEDRSGPGATIDIDHLMSREAMITDKDEIIGTVEDMNLI